MRFTNLLALAAVASVATTAANAQSWLPEHRAALGIGTRATGTTRDTLGLMITSITKGSPAEKAGLEEGNRIAAINGVSLRISAADVEDGEMSNALSRRLVRELGKVKPGDDVELRVYRDGRTQAVKVKTADSDSLFRRTDPARVMQAERENRSSLGVSIGSMGSRRDTLGVLVMSVADSSPASKAGIEEGNRIAAINGVNLRVPHEDAGDRWLSSAKAQRLEREISQLTPGDNVTLKVYSNGQFRDVSVKVARAGDLPKRHGMFYMGGGDGLFLPPMPAMPVMPAMPDLSDLPSMPRIAPMPPMEGMYFDYSPDVDRRMDEMRVHLEALRPKFEAIRTQFERIAPTIRMQLNQTRQQLEGLRMQVPRARARMVNVIV